MPRSGAQRKRDPDDCLDKSHRQGQGGGMGQSGRGAGLGPGGLCVCLDCGASAPHQQGLPCAQMKCPKCGSPMIRNK